MNTIIKRTVLISMLFIGLVFMGIFSYQYLPMELNPNAELPVLYVNISYPEQDPTFVEVKAAIPIEGVISSLGGVEEMTTTIRPSSTSIMVSFAQSVNIKYTQLQLEEKIRAISTTLPEGFTASVGAAGISMQNNNLMSIRILGDEDIDYVRNITDNDITPYLANIDGVTDVQVSGGRQRSIKIIIDPEQLEALKITKNTISNAIRQNQAEKAYAGMVYEGNKSFIVNVTAEYLATEDLGSIVVADGPILLRDIADISFGVKEPDSYSRTNGKEVVTGVISRSPTSNIIALSERVREEIDRLNEELQSKGILIEVESDESEAISNNLNSIINLALSGALLAIFVLYIFLRRLKIVGVVTFSIPISVFAAFYFFYLAGISINTLTLTGIALAVGMLLDNSIVVMENIYRLRSAGVPPEEACVQGTKEVWKSIFAATLTTVTVFLPFLFADDYMIKLLGEHVGISIIATLSISLVVALLLIPMALNAIMKRDRSDVNFNSISIHDRSIQVYIAILKMALRKPTRVIVISLIALLVTVILSTNLSLNTLREIDSNAFSASITPSPGTTLESMDEQIRSFEDELLNIEEIKEFTSTIRGEESNSTLSIKLKDNYKKINKKSIIQLRDELNSAARKANIQDISISTTVSGVSSGSSSLGNLGLLRMMGMGTQQEKIVIKGEDYEEMTTFGEYLRYQIEELDNISSARLSASTAGREANIIFDQYLMGVNEVTPANVASELTGSGPITSTSINYKAGDEEYEIVIQDIEYDENNRTTQTRSLEDLRNTAITRNDNALVELRSISTLRLATGKGNINRVNQAKDLNITYQFVSDVNESKTLLEAARNEIDELIQEQDLPMGIAIEVIHEESRMDDFTFLIIAAFLLIYMILAAVFESVTAPIVLMFTIPLAVIGALLGLLLTGNSMENATVYIGFIILIGIVINNSIILIDYTNLLRKRGYRKQRAIIVAGISRLRPILITAITTIVALFPLALGQGEYVEGIGAPFAITVIGGLAMSTILTLVIIPTLYSGMEDALKRIRTQSLFMKIVQGVLLIASLIFIYLFADGVLYTILYIIIAVILVPGITWFLEGSLRRAKSNIIPADQELIITISNLVKIYGRPSLFERELNSGKKIRERLGLKSEYNRWKDLHSLVWIVPITVFIYYFAFIYQEKFLWGIIFGLAAWFLTIHLFALFIKFSHNKEWRVLNKTLYWSRVVIYYVAPLIILIWGGKKFYNSGAAIFLGMFWYIGICAKYLSDKINKESINIDLIEGHFRMLRKSIYRLATKIPLIGIKSKPFKALSSVSMEIKTGMFGLLGPNGAGKTTLMRIICGIFEQSYGKIFINGIDTQKKREELQGLIGYLPQEFGTYENLTAAEFLEYQALLKGIYDTTTRQNRIDEVLHSVHMFENKDKKIGSFSGGMKQRIGIAQTLLNLPRILVVDEPTAGLDPRERIRFRNLLVELSRHRIVIFSTHIIEDIASSCNQVGVINKGELKYLGTPTDMANIAKDVAWSFEVPVREFAKLPSDLLIVHHIRQGDVIKVRCLSAQKPSENAEHIVPALEDSYLWLLRNVKIEGNEEIIT